MRTVSKLKAAGTSPQVITNACNSRSPSDCWNRNTSALATISVTVTTGVVRDGMTSRMGIIWRSIVRLLH